MRAAWRASASAAASPRLLFHHDRPRNEAARRCARPAPAHRGMIGDTPVPVARPCAGLARRFAGNRQRMPIRRLLCQADPAVAAPGLGPSSIEPLEREWIQRLHCSCSCLADLPSPSAHGFLSRSPTCCRAGAVSPGKREPPRRPHGGRAGPSPKTVLPRRWTAERRLTLAHPAPTVAAPVTDAASTAAVRVRSVHDTFHEAESPMRRCHAVSLELAP